MKDRKNPESWIELYDHFAHGHRERLRMGREHQDKGKDNGAKNAGDKRGVKIVV